MTCNVIWHITPNVKLSHNVTIFLFLNYFHINSTKCLHPDSNMLHRMLFRLSHVMLYVTWNVI